MRNQVPLPARPASRVDRDLAEVVAAIAMVENGAASRIRLVNLADPARVAAVGAPQASSAGVELRLERSDGTARIVVGPRR